jgi:peroxiredoxin
MNKATPYLISLLLPFAMTSAAVPDDAKMVIPIEVNSKAPAFDAKEVDGRTFRFDPTNLKKPTMIIFYRGGWCPYCNAQLQDLHIVEPQVVAMGYDVLFLSTDQPKLLYSSLKEKVDYHLLSESDMQAAHAFGVAFRMDSTGVEKLKSDGVDLDATQGNDHHELPVPSVFIVDTHGVVRFRHFDPDYTVRLDAAHLLSAAKDAIAPNL